MTDKERGKLGYYYRNIINHCLHELEVDCYGYECRTDCKYKKLCQAEIERDKALENYWEVIFEYANK